MVGQSHSRKKLQCNSYKLTPKKSENIFSFCLLECRMEVAANAMTLNTVTAILAPMYSIYAVPLDATSLIESSSNLRKKSVNNVSTTTELIRSILIKCEI